MGDRSGDGYIHEVARLQGEIKATRDFISQMKTDLLAGK